MGLKWTHDGLLDGEAAASVLCDDAQTRYRRRKGIV